MDKRENQDNQAEVEVNLIAEEEFEGGNGVASEEEITVDFGEAAESMLEDIKSDSLYGLEPETVTSDDIDPEEISSDYMANVQEVTVQDSHGQLTRDTELDEPQEAITITEEEEVVVFVDDDDAEAEEKAFRSRRRLRRMLVFFIIVLLILAAVIGVFIWRNTTPPDVKLPDSDALQTSTAGTNSTQFQPIAADSIPDLVAFFGMTPEQVVEQVGSEITLDAASTPASDAALPQVVSTRNGWIVGPTGQTLASITFGLDAAGNINYVFTSFDLDAFGVADAKFDELAASNVVASSVLTGIGLDPALVAAAQLTVTENPAAVISRDTAGQEVVEFSGPTNIEGVPSTWKLTETYDHTTGVTIGDNSVIRSLSVDLR